MKAEISKEGILSIKSETDLESFALGVWGNKNMTYNKGTTCQCGVRHAPALEGEMIITDMAFDWSGKTE